MSDTRNEPKKRGFLGRLFGGETAPTAPAEPAAAALEGAAGLERPGPEVTHEASAPAAPPAPATIDPAAHPDAPQSDAPRPEVAEPAKPPAKQGWFQRLTTGLQKTSAKLTEGIASVFTKRKLDADTMEDLEDLLIEADLGVETASRITGALAKGRYDKGISVEDVRSVLAREVEAVLAPVAQPLVIDGTHRPHVILVVGVNGSGKTTTIGKLAALHRRQGKKVLLAAGDTFRAAAIDQLKVWGERVDAPVVARDVGADAAGLAFDAIAKARDEGFDLVLIDTAGRLQNKQGLMDELDKVIRVIRKVMPDAPHDTLLVLDATTGQNAMNQVEVFKERAGVTGLVMTKLDGTAKGGILVAIAARHQVPVHAIGVGESVDDLQPFTPKDFAAAIAGA